MDGLRMRRTLQTHPKTTTTHTLTNRRARPISYYLPASLLCNVIQFLFIIYLFSRVFNQSPLNTQTKTQHTYPSEQNADVPDSPHYDFFLTIYTYDRPRQLLNLLRDVAREADAAKLSVGVNVIDDNSYGCVFPAVNENFYDVEDAEIKLFHLFHVNLSSDAPIPCSARGRFRQVEKIMKERQWNLLISKYRQGRKRYWYLVRMAHMLLRSVSSDYFIFLPDDDRLSTSFFDKASALWNSIRDARKLSLMLHVEGSRENEPNWTDLKPRYIGGDVSRIGWVESGNFICTNELLEFMNWSFPRVPLERWVNNPTISSGVGATFSELIHGSGKRMYRSRQSLVAHVGVSYSKMNAHVRDKNAPGLFTKYFADGDDVYANLLTEASTVTASIASQWNREASLHATIHSLAPQVDQLNVYLNDYDVIPSFLQAPYIRVKRGVTQGENIGDIGKFLWCNEIETEFHLTADDDIIYPEDYVSHLERFWRSYEAPVIVGAHGIRIKQEDLTPQVGKGKGYYESREVWMGVERVEKAVNVHILGTGTVMYRPSDIGRIDLNAVFTEPNMADIWLGIVAQNLRIPMMVAPHSKGWLKEVPGTFGDSIYAKCARRRGTQRAQTAAARNASPWKLHPPVKAALPS